MARSFVVVFWTFILTITIQLKVHGLPLNDSPEESTYAEKQALIHYSSRTKGVFKLYSQRIALATKLIDVKNFNIQELINDIKEADFNTQVDLIEQDKNHFHGDDDDEDEPRTKSSHGHSHISKQEHHVFVHLRNFLKKAQRKGLSRNDTVVIVDVIFAAPWPDDTLSEMHNCYVNCSGVNSFFLTPPDSMHFHDLPPTTTLIPRPPQNHDLSLHGLHSHQDHNKETDHDVDRMWRCAHACMNSMFAIGR